MEAAHIGIASITAEGGALAYREIVHAAGRVLGGNVHPEITLHSHSFFKFIEPGSSQERWAELIVDSSRKLARTGAEFFICPANTNHVVYDQVKAAVAIPWLHIASCVAGYAVERGCRRTLLLGTKRLMESSVYSDFFADIELSTPVGADADELNRIIYQELVGGKIEPSSKGFFEGLVRAHRARGGDSVVLGCTELPLFLPASLGEAVMLDSTRLVAHGALARSLGMSLLELEKVIEGPVSDSVDAPG